MTESPLVSVVIPAYNRPELLGEALENVLEQTYSNFEVHVVDDGSPERLEPVVEESADERIEYTRFEENQGANVARNEGIRRADGEYIAFLDDDDRWIPEKLEKQVELLREHEACGVAYTGRKYVNEVGKTTRTTVPTARGDLRKHLLKGGAIAPFSCLLVREEVIDAAGYPNPELPILQDREWLFRVSQHTEFVPLKESAVIRGVGEFERISDNYEGLKNVTLPYLLEEHTPFAAEFGWRYKLYFHAHLYRTVGTRALRADRYGEARYYLAKSFVRNPASFKTCYRLLVAIGGKPVYTIGKQLLHRYRRWRS